MLLAKRRIGAITMALGARGRRWCCLARPGRRCRTRWETGATTTEPAHRLGTSLASISRHAGVLRNAGLVTTRPRGTAVVHTLTRLGAALLDPASRRDRDLPGKIEHVC